MNIYNFYTSFLLCINFVKLIIFTYNVKYNEQNLIQNFLSLILLIFAFMFAVGFLTLSYIFPSLGELLDNKANEEDSGHLNLYQSLHFVKQKSFPFLCNSIYLVLRVWCYLRGLGKRKLR